MKRFFALTLTLLLALGMLPAALADSVTAQGCLVLGQDLTAQEREKVLDYLKVEDPSAYTLRYTTNEQEHAALDAYLGADVVGSRALSSILLRPREKGSGISVSSYNITYCTVEMYQNALVSAGVKDVSIDIAAPVPVSGTCALVSAMNAYSVLSGEALDAKSADAALEELVTTGDVGELLGDKAVAAELIAALKQKLVQEDMDEEQISTAIDQLSEQMGVRLDAQRRRQVIDLLMKLKTTKLSPEDLAEQAAGLYSRVSGLLDKLDLQPEKAAGVLDWLLGWVKRLLQS